jgi:hypothetical protein
MAKLYCALRVGRHVPGGEEHPHHLESPLMGLAGLLDEQRDCHADRWPQYECTSVNQSFSRIPVSIRSAV